MKKFFTCILAFLYLSTSMGASLHLHYCMGKLISLGLINHESKNCDYCGMPKHSGSSGNLVAKKGCCSDEHKELKTDQDQRLPCAENEFQKLFPGAAVLHLQGLPEYPVTTALRAQPTVHAPPIPDGQPVFLLNCNFRI